NSPFLMVFAPIYVRVIIGQNWLSGLLDYTIAQLHSWKFFLNRFYLHKYCLPFPPVVVPPLLRVGNISKFILENCIQK
ncbi:MAG: hypothetical protein LBV23_03875, partial [Deltaproteobacteria bacterium]|nr:hypothetical protein [Deltaproteobacteria bacterium]